MRRVGRAVAVVVMLAVGFAAGWVRLPYYAEGPGPARDVASLIRFEGPPRYDSAGRLVIATIRIRQLTAVDAVLAWLDPGRSILSEAEAFGGIPPEQEPRRAQSDIDQSKIAAIRLVLERLTGYPEDHGRGALVASVVPGCPADGRLVPGDVIVAVDGRPVASAEAARRRLDDAAARVTLRLTSGGTTTQLDLERRVCVPGDDRPLLGIELADPFPFDIDISSGGVGGPSAGLMYALGLYDLLTPGDLTGGRTIAGTGTIAADGSVGPIGSVADKVDSARRAGADVFLVPRENARELDGTDTADLRLIPVGTFDEALRAIGAGGQGS